MSNLSVLNFSLTQEKLREVSLEEILEAQALQQAEKEEADRLRYA